MTNASTTGLSDLGILVGVGCEGAVAVSFGSIGIG